MLYENEHYIQFMPPLPPPTHPPVTNKNKKPNYILIYNVFLTRMSP